MNWVIRTQNVIEYIEENIINDIDMNILAKMMYCQNMIFKEYFHTWLKFPYLNI